MGGGKLRVKPTVYRDGQNVIRDARSNGIVYMPPEAKGVPMLMGQLMAWIGRSNELPAPIKARQGSRITNLLPSIPTTTVTVERHGS
jgi:hypothetical protein